MISGPYKNLNATARRTFQCRVIVTRNDEQIAVFNHNDALQEVTINRTGLKGKFFGYGICQQMIVKVIYDTVLPVQKGDFIRVLFTAGERPSGYQSVGPYFEIKTIEKDETSNVYTLTAYDAIDRATGYLFRDLGLALPYTLKDIIEAIGTKLGVSTNVWQTYFDVSYEDAVNLTGDENLRAVLDAIAEATQTVYFMTFSYGSDGFKPVLTFRNLKETETYLEIPKKDYFDFTSGMPVTISKIAHITELGDNVSIGDDTGVVQYVRNNPFWDLRTDLAELLTAALERVSGLNVVPYTLKWRGDFHTEPFDKIKIEDKNGEYITTYILDDSITYKGGLSQTCTWEYTPDQEQETAENPVTVGEKINQTFARVDKANNQIQLVAGTASENTQAIAALQLNTESINASVMNIQSQVDEDIDAINDSINTLTNKVDAQITAEDVRLEVTKQLENGVDKVTTTTGFTFNENGLTIEKTGREMKTNIDEDGMSVFRNDEEVLTADSAGVIAYNLHARTYLIIGENSRFEDWEKDNKKRTACFWIGG